MRIFLAASLKLNEFLVIFGASGNTGTMAIQFGKKMGAKVIAVSKDNWIKTDFGAAYYIISDYDKVLLQCTSVNFYIRFYHSSKAMP
jgi:NADPH:quinone reductase-like Zn-dependent oxidoreductase